MKLSTHWTALLSPLLVLASLTGAPLGARAPFGTAPSSADEKSLEFRKRFQEAMKMSDATEMTKLVRTMNEQAVDWIIETAEAIAIQTNEELETRMAALRTAWKAAMETDFCTKMYEYFSLLEPNMKVERVKFQNQYELLRGQFQVNTEKKDGPTFAQLSERFRGLAEGFEQVGDRFYASRCWIFQGSCNRRDMRGGDADLYATCAAYKKAVEHREAIGLKDRYWLETKQMYDALVLEGFDGEREPDAGGGEPAAGGGPAAGPAASGAAVTVAMGFESVDDLFAFERPMYYADELYQLWNAFYMYARDTTGKISTMGDLSPTIHRVAANEIRFDDDRDGKPEKEVRVTGNLEPLEFEIGEGAEKRRWACLTTVGTDKETFQQVQVNLAPSDTNFPLYFVPAASMVGTIGTETVRVFDDNADGIYGSPKPTKLGHFGLVQGHDQPEFDSIAIGASKRARPWSKYQQVGGAWYELASAAGGNQLLATPVELATGTLKLEFQGPKPAWLIVQGKGNLADSYFDLAEGKADVPAGSYELAYGELRQGKKRQVSKAVILPGPSTLSWKVGAGETTTVELGAPFRFEFRHEHQGAQLVVKGETVMVVGSAGERYERLWNCTPRPEVSWRAAGEKRGSKPEKMDLVLDQEKHRDVFSTAVWFPLDLTLELRGEPEAVEVQLVESKNKLFGPIASEWLKN